jgi:hypothetical protein
MWKEPNSSPKEAACPQTGWSCHPEGMQRRRPPPAGYLQARSGEPGALISGPWKTLEISLKHTTFTTYLRYL